MNKQAIIESLKEFGRLVLIGAVSGAIAAGTQALGLIHNPIVVVGLGTFLTYVGKAFDKYVHKDDNINATGLVPF